ncbi:tumor necrosis factor receptor superfamily member 6 [Morus bassanus]
MSKPDSSKLMLITDTITLFLTLRRRPDSWHFKPLKTRKKNTRSDWKQLQNRSHGLEQSFQQGSKGQHLLLQQISPVLNACCTPTDSGLPAPSPSLPILQNWSFCPWQGGSCSAQQLKHTKQTPHAQPEVCDLSAMPWHSQAAKRAHPTPYPNASNPRGERGAHDTQNGGTGERTPPLPPGGHLSSEPPFRRGSSERGAARGQNGPGRARGAVIVLIIETQCKNDTEALIRTGYNKLITRRIIAKREIHCNPDEYSSDVMCCKKCRRGFVKNTSCPTDINKHCVPCENGKEYTDYDNNLEKCLRCDSCDSTFGLEVAKNCTPEKNTECTCAKNYFCDSVPCTHCDSCTICESGVIEKPCTLTSDTVCGTKGWPWWPSLLITVLPLAAGAVYLYKRKQKGVTSKEHLAEVVPTTDASCENVPLVQTDVDLSSHVPGIVEEMTLQEVKMFVRYHRVPEPVIDQILRDHFSDTSEQKIKLFQVWYQRYGIKGAYRTLISSLKEFKMCTAADKIEEKLKAAVSSCQEGGQSYNDDTEQNKTCTQEGRNSYDDSAELSKTCSGSLEET